MTYKINFHCVNSVQILSFCGPYFPVFGLNTGKYGPEKLRIWILLTQCWEQGNLIKTCQFLVMFRSAIFEYKFPKIYTNTPVNFAKLLGTLILKKICEWLLLIFAEKN